MRTAPALLAISSLLTLTSCAAHDPLAPPPITLDQTPCAECGMIVADEHYACATIVRIDANRNEARVFDDLNCLVRHETTGPHLDIAARWVHDQSTLEWVPATQAHFVRADGLHTPMMSRVAAFATAQRAEAARAELDGQSMTFAEVRLHFTPEHLRDALPPIE